MESTSTKARPTASELFDVALGEVAGDPRCTLVVARLQAHAAEVACLTRDFAGRADVCPGEAFAAGLLHDVGELLLLARDPDGYPELLAAAGTDHERQLRLEKEIYGTDHALLGAYHLLDHKLPHVVADAVADHHDPFADSDTTTLLVAAADELLGGDPGRRHAMELLEARGLRAGAGLGSGAESG